MPLGLPRLDSRSQSSIGCSQIRLPGIRPIVLLFWVVRIMNSHLKTVLGIKASPPIWMVLALGLLPGLAEAQLVHVSPSGTNSSTCGSAGSPCETIQYAVNNIASSGDTVYLMDGTYSLPSSTSAGTPIAHLKQDADMCFLGDTTGTATLNGLNLHKGFQYDYLSNCTNASGSNNNTVFSLHLSFIGLRFINCFTPQFQCGTTTFARGGAIHLINDPASKLFTNIIDCEFIHCQAADSIGPNNHGRSVIGGAVHINGRSVPNASDSSVVKIHNCVFKENAAIQLPNGGHGGAVGLYLVSIAEITNSSFCSNYVFGINADNGDLQHDRNAGGAILFYDFYNSNPGHELLVDSCIFFTNSATTTGGSNFNYNSEGGAIYLTRGDNLSAATTADLTISNSTFTGNYIETGVEHYDNNSGSVTTSNNILSNNPNIQLLGGDISICAGDSHEFSIIAPGFDILWSDSSTGTSLTVFDSDTIWVSITNGSCSFEDTAIVTKHDPLPPPAIDDTVLCPTSVMVVHIPNAYTNILWNDGSTLNSRFITEAGGYGYTALDVNDCQVADSFQVTLHTRQAFLLQNDSTVCNEDSLKWCLNDHSGLTFTQWSNGDTSRCRVFPFATTDDFTYVDDFGCTWSDTLSVAFKTTDDAYLEDTVTCCQDSCTAIVPTYSILGPVWSNGDTTASFLPGKSGKYSVIHGDTGCRIEEVIRFNIIDCDTAVDSIIDPIDSIIIDTGLIDSIPETPCDTLETNVFTPNGDGLNEWFRPWDPQCEQLVEMVVYNRWGTKVWVQEGAESAGWDGTKASGRESEVGVYFFLVTVNVRGELVKKQGSFTLLR